MKQTFKTIAALTALSLGVSLSGKAQTSWSTSTGNNLLNNTYYLGTTSASTFKDIVFKTNAAERMRILGTGNIGIGTSAPLDKLHIDKGILRLSGNNSAGGPMIWWSATATSAAKWGIEYVSGANGGLNFWIPYISGNAGGNHYLFLSDLNGNVGVGTNNPTAKLTVNGNMLVGELLNTTLPSGYKLYVRGGILTDKVKIGVHGTSDWSDYVFADNYKLKSIAELEAYVKTNKHLPNVPSAEEVVKEGIDVAKMDAKLLEKIEELSLYIIQLKNENMDLLKRVENLESK